MSGTRAPWRAVFLTYPCTSCGAKPNEECTTRNGKVAEVVHAARTRYGDRCPRCGSLVAADDNPGAYCPRCQLLRALEIERVTTHKRVT